MAEDPSSGEGRGQGWWDAIPGTLKAAAAAVTAVTGLLLALNQIGWLGREREEAPAATAPPAAVAAAPSPAASGGGYRVTFPEGSTASLRSSRAEGKYEILSSTVEARGGGRYQLKLSVRLTSAGPLDLGFYTDSFRLLADGVPRAPVNNLIAAVDARSSKEADILFDLPTSASKLELEVANGEDSATLPMLLERAR